MIWQTTGLCIMSVIILPVIWIVYLGIWLGSFVIEHQEAVCIKHHPHNEISMLSCCIWSTQKGPSQNKTHINIPRVQGLVSVDYQPTSSFAIAYELLWHLVRYCWLRHIWQRRVTSPFLAWRDQLPSLDVVYMNKLAVMKGFTRVLADIGSDSGWCYLFGKDILHIEKV